MSGKALTGGAGLGVILLAGVLLIGGTAVLGIFLALMPSGEDEAGNQPSQCTANESSLDQVPEEYHEAVENAAAESGFSSEIIAAQIQQESNWNENAESHAGAQGLAQFMPATWEQYGEGDITDGVASIEAQGRFMAELRDFAGDYAETEEETAKIALAAYNAGPGAVEQADGIPNFSETQDYVRIIMNAAQGEFSADCSRAGMDIGELGTGEWTNPLPGGTVASRFGSRPCPIASALNCAAGVSDHRGIDFASPPPGSTVLAPMDIQIRYTGTTDTGLGETVLAEMTETPYLHVEFGHCKENSFHVQAGDTVAAGEPVCDEGNTGNSAGAHLHLQFGDPEGGSETEPGWDNLIDPEPFLKEKGVL